MNQRLRGAGIDFSPERALEALATVRHVTFRLEGQANRCGVAGGSPDARRVLKALGVVDLHPPTAPEGMDAVM